MTRYKSQHERTTEVVILIISQGDNQSEQGIWSHDQSILTVCEV